MSESVFERWFALGSGLAGSLVGAVGGAAVSGVPGAALGAVLGESLEHGLSELGGRMLSQRERERVGAVALLARESLLKRLTEGDQLRGDDFLRARVDGRSPAIEVIEHILLVSQRSYEERKLPHVAAVLARVAVSSWMDERTAHWIVNAVERLSWPKLVALALVADNAEFPLPERELGKGFNEWSPWSAHNVFLELQWTDQMLSRKPRTGEHGEPRFESYLNDYGLTNPGQLVHSVADLSSIAQAHKDELRAVFEGESSPQ